MTIQFKLFKQFTPSPPWELGVRRAKYRVADSELNSQRGKSLSPEQLAHCSKEFECISIGCDGPKGGTVALIPMDESNMLNAKLLCASPALLLLAFESIRMFTALQERMEIPGEYMDYGTRAQSLVDIILDPTTNTP